MEQMSLFSTAGQSRGLPNEVLEYKAGFLSEEKSDILPNDFIADVPWHQKIVKIYDK